MYQFNIFIGFLVGYLNWKIEEVVFALSLDPPLSCNQVRLHSLPAILLSPLHFLFPPRLFLLSHVVFYLYYTPKLLFVVQFHMSNGSINRTKFRFLFLTECHKKIDVCSRLYTLVLWKNWCLPPSSHYLMMLILILEAFLRHQDQQELEHRVLKTCWSLHHQTLMESLLQLPHLSNSILCGILIATHTNESIYTLSTWGKLCQFVDTIKTPWKYPNRP